MSASTAEISEYAASHQRPDIAVLDGRGLDVTVVGGLTGLILVGCLYGRTLWVYLEIVGRIVLSTR